MPVCSVPIRRMAARFGTPARNASIAVRASSIMRKPHQRGQRVLPVAGPHIRPHAHLQRRVLAQRAAGIAGGERRIRQHRHEQPRQMLGIVNDLPQHLVGIHHRGRGIAQQASPPAVRTAAARPAPPAARRHRPCAGNGRARPASRAHWCARCEPRCRRCATPRPAPSRPTAIAPPVRRLSSSRLQPRQTERQQGGAEILRQPAILPQIGGQPLIHVAGQQVGRHGEGSSQVGHRHRLAGPRPA